MSTRTKLKFKQLGVILIAWLTVATVMTMYDYLVVHSMNTNGASSFYSFGYALVSNCLSAVIGCVIGGSFLVFVINERYDEKPFMYTILTATAVYFAVIAIILVSITVVALLHSENSNAAISSVGVPFRFLTDETRIKNIFTWYVVVAATQMVVQLSKRFGEGNLLRILKGDYNVAREEKKVFMFLDLNDSTGLAERLGDERYHNMLRDFFSDITDAIVDNRGRIYQYVGDEVVVQWDYQVEGSNDNCVKTFFDIKAKIAQQKNKYERRYGVVPTFKAGIHYGRVIAGEVGTVKREITYSGDVLNTTSRIMSMCSMLKTDLLVSGELAAVMGSSRYNVLTHGVFALKGKDKEVTLQSYLPVAGNHPGSEMRLAWLRGRSPEPVMVEV
jgi:adenylate cyclase